MIWIVCQIQRVLLSFFYVKPYFFFNKKKSRTEEENNPKGIQEKLKVGRLMN